MDLSNMLLSQVSYGAAFVAGLASFLSPCILPLIPAWLTLLSGLDYLEVTGKKNKNISRLFWPTLLFVLGFSLIFCLMGAAAGYLGQLLQDYAFLLRYPAGAFMIFFGLYLSGLIKPKFMMLEKRVQINKRPFGLAGSFIVGMGFAAGWTPCVGPILGTILTAAALEQSSLGGLKLLLIYSLGLGLPFIALSLFWASIWPSLSKMKAIINHSGRILGVLMIIVGLLLIFGKLNLGLI